MTDAATEYLKWREAFFAAEAALLDSAGKYAEVDAQVGDRIKRNWRRLYISNLPRNAAGYPQWVLAPPSLPRLASELPDALPLHEMLTAARHAEHEMREAWIRVPEKSREGLEPPPDPT